MSAYKYIRNAWKNPKENLNEIWKERLVQWRKEPATVRISHPTRLDKARSLGYKAKQGIILVRQRLNRSKRMRDFDVSGRRPKTFRHRRISAMNYQFIAEQRASKKYINCEVLNSYYAGEDGMHFWFEIILLDKNHPAVLADKRYSWISGQKGRAFRGLTTAGRRTRGLMNKGKGAEKFRPSKNAVYMRKARKQYG
jgi:large subunit ribosomal protein L15e